MIETIHFYHTNDIHSHFKHWPRIHELLVSRKKWHREEGDPCYTLDLGDHIDRSHIFTEGTLGKGNVELLNQAQYDVVTIGNNEGITLSHTDLENLYTDAKFEVVVGNLLDGNEQIPAWLVPTTILTTTNGTRIGVVALTAQFTQFYEELGWKVTDAFVALERQLEELKPVTDIRVCLSHLGIRADEAMAEKYPDIDLIFGAHTHHVLHEGKHVNNSLLAAAGKFGLFVGHVTLEFDTAAKSILKRQAILYDTNELKKLPGEELYLEGLVEAGKQSLMKTAFYQPKTLPKEWFGDSGLSDLFGKALTAFCQADCALFNAGIFLTDLKAGNVSFYDIHQMMPHPINPCAIELTGKELRDIYDLSLNESWPNLEVKGLGFRGVVMGKMIAHGFAVENGIVLVQGRKIEPDEKIMLATLDMYTFGYFYPLFKELPKTYYMPEFIRDVLIAYGQKQQSHA